MRVPAVCDICGSIFPSGIVVDNIQEAHFSGVSAGPCPKCGGQSHIPDGVYRFINDTITLLNGPNRSIYDLQRLEKILQNAKDKQIPINIVNEKISKEIPELSSLKDILPKSRSDFYAFISILLTIIGLILTQLSKESTSKIEVNQVINNIYQQQNLDSSSVMKFPKPKQIAKIGRNDRCPCGSGKKYKVCHGK